jgi:hypothetical protein
VRDLVALAGSNEWPVLLGSEKLAAFTREVIVERRIFDERSLRLTPPT